MSPVIRPLRTQISMSMSGGPLRSGDRKRSNSSPSATESTLVMPSE